MFVMISLYAYLPMVNDRSLIFGQRAQRTSRSKWRRTVTRRLPVLPESGTDARVDVSVGSVPGIETETC